MRTLWFMVLVIAVGPVGIGYHYYQRANRENRAEITALLKSQAEDQSQLRDFLVASHPRRQPGEFEGVTLGKVKFSYVLGENMMVDSKADVTADFSFKFHRATVRLQMAKEGPPPKVWTLKSYNLAGE